MFETQVRATTLVRSVISSSMFDRSSRPSSAIPNQRSVAPVRSVSSCHGTMLEWCSISVMSTSSPSPIASGPLAQARVFATRLIASEAFLVKITSSRDGAFRNAATLSRPPSKPAVDSAPSWCMARATFALCRSRWSTIASITTCGFCEVFALSRYTRGCPSAIVRCRIGKSARTRSSPSSSPGSAAVTVMPVPSVVVG